MSYYEIVPQGMQEDSLVFVDRIAHECNGITEQGMPEYLSREKWFAYFAGRPLVVRARDIFLQMWQLDALCSC